MARSYRSGLVTPSKQHRRVQRVKTTFDKLNRSTDETGFTASRRLRLFLGPVHIKSMRSDSAILVSLQGIASAMCLLHISEYNAAGRKNGQSRRVTPEMGPCSVAHRLFGFTNNSPHALPGPISDSNASAGFYVNRP